jgi:hypothetical protein
MTATMATQATIVLLLNMGYPDRARRLSRTQIMASKLRPGLTIARSETEFTVEVVGASLTPQSSAPAI